MAAALPSILSPAQLDAVRRPFKAARLLPPKVFHDPAIFRFELDNWFARDWICVGREEDAANRGDRDAPLPRAVRPAAPRRPRGRRRERRPAPPR